MVPRLAIFMFYRSFILTLVASLCYLDPSPHHTCVGTIWHWVIYGLINQFFTWFMELWKRMEWELRFLHVAVWAFISKAFKISFSSSYPYLKAASCSIHCQCPSSVQLANLLHVNMASFGFWWTKSHIVLTTFFLVCLVYYPAFSRSFVINDTN